MKRTSHTRAASPLLTLALSLLFSLTAAAYDTLPISLTKDDGLLDNFEFSYEDWQEHFFYTSPVYRLEKEVNRLRFTVTETTSGDAGGGFPCFAIAEFYIYDANGNALTLSVNNFSTNAQEPKEGPMKNICDNDYGTFFHSLWSSYDNSTGPHYIDVKLPKSMKEFAFGYVSRYENVAPAAITVDDADALDHEKDLEDEERERYENHTDTLLCTATQVVKGQEWDVDLALQSSDDYVHYTALQMDIIPAHTELTGEGIDVSFELNRDRLPSHTLSVGTGDWATPRVVIYSMTLDSIRGLDGPLVHVHITSQEVIPPGRYVFYVAGIRLTTTKKQERMLNAIEVALVSTDPNEPESNNVYLTSDAEQGSVSISTEQAKPGERVYLHANPANGWAFSTWSAAEDDVTINAPTSAHTYFVMPDHDVHITATFVTTGIDALFLTPDEDLYGLDGRRRTTTSSQRGILISKGKKILVK